ncbi:hypothetical protein V1525DRAFT_411522 [Lipomyces kononenkoae]|uniref:Uncharacterized protein n=1 Tax=Lipomyces kononenkoae TaxID=34357 RepID=A0ACC3SVX1_LIPKO
MLYFIKKVKKARSASDGAQSIKSSSSLPGMNQSLATSSPSRSPLPPPSLQIQGPLSVPPTPGQTTVSVGSNQDIQGANSYAGPVKEDPPGTRHTNGYGGESATSSQGTSREFTVLVRSSSLNTAGQSPETLSSQLERHLPYSFDPNYRNPFRAFSKQPETPEPTPDDVSARPLEAILAWYLFKSHILELIKDHYHQLFIKVKQLESQLANSSIDSNRYLLDDYSYIFRFQLLHRNLAQFAFQWRAQWCRYPDWIEHFSIDHTSKLKCIKAQALLTEWLADDIFDKMLHPGLNLDESLLLKSIETSIILKNDEQSESEPKEDVAAWRTTALKARLDSKFLNLEGERDAIKMTPQYQDHQQAALNSFRKRFSFSLHPQTFSPDGCMNESFSAGLNIIIEEVLTLISFMSLENRDIRVYRVQPGSLYSAENMRCSDDDSAPQEGSSVAFCTILGLTKKKGAHTLVLYRPEVLLRNKT